MRELVGALNRLAAHAELSGAEITVEFAKNQLRDLLQAYQRMVTIDDIQRSVSEYYQLKVADLHGVRRTRQVARPRQIAMYLCKQLTKRSYPELGRHFGGRDHTTIIHGCRTIDGLMPKDESLRKDVDILTRMLKG